MSRATISRAELERMAKDAGPQSPLHAMLKELKGTGKKERKPPTPPPASQGRTLRIVVPLPPNFANPAAKASRNPFAVNGRKKKYWRMLAELAKAGLIPAPPSPCFGAVKVTSTMYVGARMDQDNSVSRHKWVFDWLQDNGYLHNDRLVDWTGMPTQTVTRRRVDPDAHFCGLYRIELELREP